MISCTNTLGVRDFLRQELRSGKGRTERERERQTDRQTDRETERGTQREREGGREVVGEEVR